MHGSGQKGFLLHFMVGGISHLFISNKIKLPLLFQTKLPNFLALPSMSLLHLCESMDTCFAMPKGAKSNLPEWTTIIKFNIHKHF